MDSDGTLVHVSSLLTFRLRDDLAEVNAIAFVIWSRQRSLGPEHALRRVKKLVP